MIFEDTNGSLDYMQRQASGALALAEAHHVFQRFRTQTMALQDTQEGGCGTVRHPHPLAWQGLGCTGMQDARGEKGLFPHCQCETAAQNRAAAHSWGDR